jgi:RimJ/RimL family protein N-acetyltransferase
VILEGHGVRLEPLALAHVEALLAAAGESRASYALTSVPADRAAMVRYVEAALAADCVAFATVWRERVVGSTRFGNLERWGAADRIDAVEIGWTWLAASAQRTPVNSAAKLLMLDHAFDVWRVHRVTLKTDARNARSRAAIERLGARLDGVLRAHMPAADGGVRDSAVYSILVAEWPGCRARLLDRSTRSP